MNTRVVYIDPLNCMCPVSLTSSIQVHCVLFLVAFRVLLVQRAQRTLVYQRSNKINSVYFEYKVLHVCHIFCHDFFIWSLTPGDNWMTVFDPELRLMDVTWKRPTTVTVLAMSCPSIAVINISTIMKGYGDVILTDSSAFLKQRHVQLLDCSHVNLKHNLPYWEWDRPPSHRQYRSSLRNRNFVNRNHLDQSLSVPQKNRNSLTRLGSWWS